MIDPNDLRSLYYDAMGGGTWHNQYEALRKPLIEFYEKCILPYAQRWDSTRVFYLADMYDDGYYNGSVPGSFQSDFPNLIKETRRLEEGISNFTVTFEGTRVVGLMQCLNYVINNHGRVQEDPLFPYSTANLYEVRSQVASIDAGIWHQKQIEETYPIFQR